VFLKYKQGVPLCQSCGAAQVYGGGYCVGVNVAKKPAVCLIKRRGVKVYVNQVDSFVFVLYRDDFFMIIVSNRIVLYMV